MYVETHCYAVDKGTLLLTVHTASCAFIIRFICNYYSVLSLNYKQSIFYY